MGEAGGGISVFIGEGGGVLLGVLHGEQKGDGLGVTGLSFDKGVKLDSLTGGDDFNGGGAPLAGERRSLAGGVFFPALIVVSATFFFSSFFFSFFFLSFALLVERLFQIKYFFVFFTTRIVAGFYF